MRVLRTEDYHIQPWKNGQGSTTQLAAGPLSEDGAGFAWRLSIADVAADGPFSLFPNIDRVITVIDGAGMMLDAGPNGAHVLEPLKPFAFPGEWQIGGHLKAGPVRDFNLMVDRRHGKGTVAFDDFGNGALVLSAKKALRFVHLLTGKVRCGGEVLEAGQTLLLDPEDIELDLGGEGTALYGDITLKA